MPGSEKTGVIEHFYVLIMAGGGGTRLWPLSRQARPKQVLPLVDNQQSMFQMTVRRLQPLVQPERIYVVTGPDHVAALQADTPEVPAENFIIEPFGRNSGPAAALGTLVISARDREAVIAVLSSDHYIANTPRFREVLAVAASLAQTQTIVTLGISPSRPATEFGYIKRGALIDTREGFACFQADSFTEKPDSDTAMIFLSAGLFSWNSGMFIWQTQTILAEYERQQPEIYAGMEKIRPLIGTPDFVDRITPIWQTLPSISLDYAVMEHAPQVVVIPVDIGWSDIGSWELLYEILHKQDQGNVTLGKSQDTIMLDTTGTLIVSDRLVVTIGVNDLIVVDTDDALLICDRQRAQDVREVVRRLKDRRANEYL